MTRSTGWLFPWLFSVPALVYCSSGDDGAPAGEGAGGSVGGAGEAGAAGSSGGGSGVSQAGGGVRRRRPARAAVPEQVTGARDAHRWCRPAPESSGEYFSDEIPDDELDAPLALPNPWGYRLLLVEGGDNVAPEGSARVDEVFTNQAPGVDLVMNAIYDYRCPALADTAYMRWDRFLAPRRTRQRRSVPSDRRRGRSDDDGDLYDRGFARRDDRVRASTTTSVGAEFEGLSVALEETLSEVYSSTITLYEEESHEFSQTVQGVADATRQFMIWQLVDRLSVTDGEGEPLSDPNYEFPPLLLEIPSGKALNVTDFDH